VDYIDLGTDNHYTRRANPKTHKNRLMHQFPVLGCDAEPAPLAA
jgi:hypothetical protein